MKKFLKLGKSQIGKLSLGIAGLLGLISNQASAKEVIKNQNNNNTDTNNKKTAEGQSLNTSTLLRYYWGPSKDISSEEIVNLENAFGTQPSESKIQSTLDTALTKMSPRKGIVLDSKGNKEKKG